MSMKTKAGYSTPEGSQYGGLRRLSAGGYVPSRNQVLVGAGN